MISLYVDDIVYTSSSPILIEEFKTKMMSTFNMSNLGMMNYFLELEVKKKSDGIFIRQRNYIEDLLHQLNMKQCKPVMTPMAVNERL